MIVGKTIDCSEVYFKVQEMQNSKGEQYFPYKVKISN